MLRHACTNIHTGTNHVHKNLRAIRRRKERMMRKEKRHYSVEGMDRKEELWVRKMARTRRSRAWSMNACRMSLGQRRREEEPTKENGDAQHLKGMTYTWKTKWIIFVLCIFIEFSTLSDVCSKADVLWCFAVTVDFGTLQAWFNVLASSESALTCIPVLMDCTPAAQGPSGIPALPREQTRNQGPALLILTWDQQFRDMFYHCKIRCQFKHKVVVFWSSNNE